VVVNNAGSGLSGMTEELAEQDVRAQFDTNVFGALRVTQAALPTCAPRAAATSSCCPACSASPRSPPRAAAPPPRRPSRGWPLRVFFSTLAHQVIPQLYAERLKTWQERAEVSAEAEAGQG
jgi:NAD(P)-dependent dehydrogenase (short-subunit alcohol dehydrogenase family)